MALLLRYTVTMWEDEMKKILTFFCLGSVIAVFAAQPSVKMVGVWSPTRHTNALVLVTTTNVLDTVSPRTLLGVNLVMYDNDTGRLDSRSYTQMYCTIQVDDMYITNGLKDFVSTTLNNATKYIDLSSYNIVYTNGSRMVLQTHVSPNTDTTFIRWDFIVGQFQ